MAHFKLFLWSDENTVFGKSYNAVNLGVRSTWPLNCARIILTHSADSPVWYFVNMLLFHVQRLFKWFPKYVWKLITHFCVNRCFHTWYKKQIFEISGWTNTNTESNKSTHFKPEINKVSTNKRCQILENILPINETPERNSKWYCNVDFVFTFDPTNPSCIFDIKVIFSIMNLYLRIFKMYNFRHQTS